MFLVPYIVRWIRRRRKRYQNSVLSVLEHVVSSSALFKTIILWHENTLFIARSLKFCMSIRSLLYIKLMSRWNQNENFFFHKKQLKLLKKKSKIKGKKSKSHPISTIPDKIKIYYLSRLIKAKLAPYIQNAKNYRILCREIDQENKLREFEIFSNQDLLILYPPKPKSPNLLQSIKDEELLELINEAERERSKWPGLLHKLNWRIYR